MQSRWRLSSPISLQSQVDDLKIALSVASARLSQLDAESKKAIEAEIWVLHQALKVAAGETIKLIKESKKTRNLLLFRTEKSIAKNLGNQLSIVIRSLDASIASSDRVLHLSMHNIKLVEDYRNQHILPTKHKIKVTVTQVEHKKATASAELRTKRVEASKAADELSRATSQLNQKQNELSSNRSQLWSKQDEARRAEERQASHERQARNYENRARAATERAEKLRTRAVWTAVLTLGIGFGFAIADACEASNLDSNARSYSSQASDSARLARTLRGTCSSIEQQIQVLESESRTLETQKANIEWRKQRHQQEVNTLESRVSALNHEVASANSLSSDLVSVDSQTEKLAETTRLLQRSLQQLKADISQCLETLTEQRDIGTLTARKAGRKYITDQKRIQLLQSAGEVLPQITKSQKMLPSVQPRTR
ncbi:hypothetical protein Dda_2196 [Drechslerella dactyloides]|uniref:Uncharacterized protein n=1 Tax=Drechslerella dactyloides TaxID=74499 RepID=A0AAD6J388_DREDA|nr:hypothetical protein Dda_2196 [Drechslerella dactyloides]